MTDSEASHESNTDLGKRGEHCHHDCMLDEQLGLTCRLCNIVCTEAKDIFPPMVALNSNQISNFFLYFTWDPIIDCMHISFLRSSLVRTTRGLNGAILVRMIMYLTFLFLRFVLQNPPKLRNLGMCGLQSLILNQSYLLIKEKPSNLYGKTWQDHYSLKKWMIQQVKVVVWLHILQERVKLCCWFHFFSVTWKFTQEADHWSLLQKLQSIHGGESFRNGAFCFRYMCFTTLIEQANWWEVSVRNCRRF